MSMAMVDELIKDIARSVEYLDSHFTINVNDVHKPEGKSLAVSHLSLFSSCHAVQAPGHVHTIPINRYQYPVSVVCSVHQQHFSVSDFNENIC